MSAGTLKLENKFDDLLLPAKDMKYSWDMDIIKPLSDYLNEISYPEYSDNTTNLNFAEAAVLIQDATSIYCSKVDLLWKFLLNILDILNEKRAYGKNIKEPIPETSNDYGHCFSEFPSLISNLKADKKTLCPEGHFKMDPNSKLPIIPLVFLSNIKQSKLMKVPIFLPNHDILGYKQDFRLNCVVCEEDGIAKLISNQKIVDANNSSWPTHVAVHPKVSSSIDENEDHHNHQDLRCSLNISTNKHSNVTEESRNIKETNEILNLMFPLDPHKKHDPHLIESPTKYCTYEVPYELLHPVKEQKISTINTFFNNKVVESLIHKVGVNVCPELLEAALLLKPLKKKKKNLSNENDGASGKETLEKSNILISNYECSTTMNSQTYDHLQEYLMLSQNHFGPVNSEKQLDDWEEIILPKLDNVKEQSQFDIWEYSNYILDQFPEHNTSNSLTFTDVCKNHDRNDIARLFLVTLVLASNQTVDIIASGNELHLTLVSKQQNEENLQKLVKDSCVYFPSDLKISAKRKKIRQANDDVRINYHILQIKVILKLLKYINIYLF